jgi:hypothetical protein
MGKTAKKKISAEMGEKLEYGKLYKRSALRVLSPHSLERHIAELVDTKVLRKQAPGIYLCIGGVTGDDGPVPDERELLETFLRDDRYLVLTEADYKAAGLPVPKIKGEKLIYNHKRHGHGRKFRLGAIRYEFRVKPFIPKKITKAFLIVDVINNLDFVTGDKKHAQRVVKNRAAPIPQDEMKEAINEYAGARARKFFKDFLEA